MRLDLQIEQPHIVAVAQRRRRHEFEPERFQGQEDARVHERTRMHAEQLHGALPLGYDWQ